MWELVTPELRGVSAGLTGDCIDIRLMYAVPVGEDALEDASLVGTYVAGDFGEDVQVDATAVELPPGSPRELPAGHEWVLLRKE